MTRAQIAYCMLGIITVSLLLSLACSDSDSLNDASAQTSTPAASTSEPTATPALTAADTPTVAPSTTPERSVEEDGPPDLKGAPYSTSDVRAAIENGGLGFSFLYFERQPLCPQTSVPELPVWSANLAGSDFGAVYAVWVYPDEASLSEEWDVSGERPRPLLDGCELPTEFVYSNANVVMAFEVWSGLGEEYTVEEHGESPDEHPAVLAFLNDLGREPVVLTVEPESGTCSEELTLSGSGLPPGAEVEIVVGESGSNNGVSKGTVVADDQGRFELLTTPSPPLIPQCGSAGVLEFRVFAEGFSGWGSAEYEYEPQ